MNFMEFLLIRATSIAEIYKIVENAQIYKNIFRKACVSRTDRVTSMQSTGEKHMCSERVQPKQEHAEHPRHAHAQ